MRVCVCGQERGRVCVCVHAIGRERVREREGVAEFLGGWTHQPTFFRWNGSKMSSILTPTRPQPQPPQKSVSVSSQQLWTTSIYFFAWLWPAFDEERLSSSSSSSFSKEIKNWIEVDLISSPEEKFRDCESFSAKSDFGEEKSFSANRVFFGKNAETAESDKKWSNKLVSNKLEKSRCFVFSVLLF